MFYDYELMCKIYDDDDILELAYDDGYSFDEDSVPSFEEFCADKTDEVFIQAGSKWDDPFLTFIYQEDIFWEDMAREKYLDDYIKSFKNYDCTESFDEEGDPRYGNYINSKIDAMRGK